MVSCPKAEWNLPGSLVWPDPGLSFGLGPWGSGLRLHKLSSWLQAVPSCFLSLEHPGFSPTTGITRRSWVALPEKGCCEWDPITKAICLIPLCSPQVPQGKLCKKSRPGGQQCLCRPTAPYSCGWSWWGHGTRPVLDVKVGPIKLEMSLVGKNPPEAS